MPESETDFLAILRALSGHHVEYIVTGGVCAVLHGAPLATFDLDIVHSRTPENLERLRAALAGLGAYYREHAARRPVPQTSHLAGPGHHLLMTRAGALDVPGEVGRHRGYDDLLGRTVTAEIEPGLRIRALSLPALIALKK
ncbi:MAG: hypothetical protein QME96_06185, partial [Myxococcota bacterium]|nr:hypothetical protein [Myxococcota bacterium]